MTTTTARRIPTWRIHLTAARHALFGPDHTGATTRWLEDLRNAGTASNPAITDTAIIPTVRRQPIAALTAAPHWEACDELGPWNPSQHELQPARLAGETTGSTR